MHAYLRKICTPFHLFHGCAKKTEKKIREMPIKNVTLQHAFSLSGRVLSGLGGNDFGNMLFLQYIQGEIRMLSR